MAYAQIESQIDKTIVGHGTPIAKAKSETEAFTRRKGAIEGIFSDSRELHYQFGNRLFTAKNVR